MFCKTSSTFTQILYEVVSYILCAFVLLSCITCFLSVASFGIMDDNNNKINNNNNNNNKNFSVVFNTLKT